MLRDTSMPAAVSEVAFLSNPQQEQNLINSASGPGYRQTVADVISLAITQFLGAP